MGALSRAPLLLGSCALALYVLGRQARLFWPFTVDDTFITLRYAKHLAEGLGPTWNPGATPVEGYTSALWMALLSLPHALAIDALHFAKLAGAAFAAGSLGVAAALSFELTRGLDVRARQLSAAGTLLLGASYWPLALHAISGMETALAALLLTTFALVSVRHARFPSPLRARSLALLALCSALTRPEAALSAGLALALQLLVVERAQRGPLLRAVALYCLLPGALYFAARYAYYGLLFPLPFYVKATQQVPLAGLPDVRAFFRPFVLERPTLLLLALLGCKRTRALLPWSVGALSFALFFIFPAHVMGFEGRYLFPLLPSLLALSGAGLARLAASLAAALEKRAPRALPWLEPALTGMFALYCLRAPFPRGEHEARERWVAYGEGLQRAHVALATKLRKERLGVLHPTIALLDVGAVAYYSEWTAVDTYGLNDQRVALSARSDIDYVFARRPELLVVVSGEAERYTPLFAWEEPLHRRALERGFRPLCSYRFLDDYHLLLLAKPDSALTEAQLCERGSSSLAPSAAAVR